MTEKQQQEPFEGVPSCQYCGKIITEDQPRDYIYVPSLDMGREKKPIHISCVKKLT